MNFRKYTRPIIDYLSSYGLNVHLNARNNILINNLKISGNAEHIFKNRVLHHGTLLFNSDLRKMNQCLQDNSRKYGSKAIPSVRSEVTNISQYIKQKFTSEEFQNQLYYYFSNKMDFDNPDFDDLNANEFIDNQWTQFKFTRET